MMKILPTLMQEYLSYKRQRNSEIIVSMVKCEHIESAGLEPVEHPPTSQTTLI